MYGRYIYLSLSWLTETENGFLEPKDSAFRFGECTSQSLSENMTNYPHPGSHFMAYLPI